MSMKPARPGSPASSSARQVAPAFSTAARQWGRIGILSFGGPAAQIALMHRVVVDERGWMTERQFMNALSFCMLLPGPEAMQLATYCGWRLHGVKGGLIAGLLFVLPGALVILALASFYVLYGSTPAMQTVFLGIKAAVLVIVLEALIKVARRALDEPLHWLIAAASFVALFFLAVPFPLVIVAAGLLGFATARAGSASDEALAPVRLRSTVRTVLVWLAIWLVPVALAGGGILGEIGWFFSKLATVTFGGAYAVLAYMAQAAVETKGWLSATEMMDGLGLAETTPGPLILVTEFVGFITAARQSGEPDLAMGLAGALVTLWATFAPCFLWVFAGAPYVEWIASRRRLSRGLAAISAAVVGVILNLSIWFALHVFFASVGRSDHGILVLWLPDLSTIDIAAVALSALAAAMLLVAKRGVLVTLAVCAVLSLAAGMVIARPSVF
jgi:chromate transporter